MDTRQVLYLCVGSACHHLGVAEILPRLQAAIDANHLSDRIVLKGTFCINCCSEGVALKYGGRVFGHMHPNNVETVFRDEILPVLLADLARVA